MIAAETPAPFWTRGDDELCDELSCDTAGLGGMEAAARLLQYGSNADTLLKRPSVAGAILQRLLEPLSLILLSAGIASTATGDHIGGAIIVTILVLSIGLDTLQEGRAVKAADVLRRSVALKAEVKRDGAFVPVQVDAVVPGDVIECVRATSFYLGIFRVCPRKPRTSIFLKSTGRRTGMKSSDYRGARSYAAAGARLIHPMLMVFPIAFLAGVLATDLAFWGTGDHFWARASEWLLAVGVILGAVVADLGLIAFITVSRVRSRVAGWVYSWGNAAAILIALWNLLYRAENDLGAAVIPLGVILSAVVVVLFLITGWLAGELVFRHRVGVIDGKNESGWPIVRDTAEGPISEH